MAKEKYEYDEKALTDVGFDNNLENNATDALSELVQADIEDDLQNSDETEIPEQIETETEQETVETDETISEEELENIENSIEESSKGNLNIALHKEREKKALFKQELDLKSKELELKERELELLRSQIGSLNTQKETIEDDILAELGEDDIITKADIQKVLSKQAETLRKQQELSFQETQAEKERESGIRLRKKYGSEFGEFSAENVFKKFQAGELKLTEGNMLDVKNAVRNGNDPGEIFYNAAISSDPLFRQRFEIFMLKRNSKTSNKRIPNKEETISTKELLDFKLSRNNDSNNMKEHINKIVDGLF